jgi:hypothetical protein
VLARVRPKRSAHPSWCGFRSRAWPTLAVGPHTLARRCPSMLLEGCRLEVSCTLATHLRRRRRRRRRTRNNQTKRWTPRKGIQGTLIGDGGSRAKTEQVAAADSSTDDEFGGAAAFAAASAGSSRTREFPANSPHTTSTTQQSNGRTGAVVRSALTVRRRIVALMLELCRRLRRAAVLSRSSR